MESEATGESNPPPELIPSPITHRPPPASLPPHLADFTWQQMLRTPIFWLMYLMLTMISVGGLMAVAELGPMARRYGVEDVPVTLLGFTAAALPFALTLERVMNGVTRPFFGWVSDHLGRENTMFVAFGLEGVAILLLINLAHIPILFVLLIGLTFFAWGEAFSLFPALCGDVFGPRFATTNYGLLYTAKGLGFPARPCRQLDLRGHRLLEVDLHARHRLRLDRRTACLAGAQAHGLLANPFGNAAAFW